MDRAGKPAGVIGVDIYSVPKGGAALKLLAALLVLAAGALAQPSDEPSLDRVLDKMGQLLQGVPNFTCTKIMQPSSTTSFGVKLLLTPIRFEVAVVGGRELFAWPGEDAFQESLMDEVLADNTVTLESGSFAGYISTLRNLGKPVFSAPRAEAIEGLPCWRWDFNIPPHLARHLLSVGNVTGYSGLKGSLWVNRHTLELRRIKVAAKQMPANLLALGLAGARERIDYARSPAGQLSFLLPASSEIVTTATNGDESGNLTRYEGCRQYVGQSTIHFDEAPSAAPVRKQAAGPLLPPGASFEIRLDAPIEDGKAYIGQEVTATLLKPSGPQPVRVYGRLRRARASEAGRPYYIVGVQLTGVESGGKRTPLIARLDEVSAEKAIMPFMPRTLQGEWQVASAEMASHRIRLEQITPPRPGEGIFLVLSSRSIPAGLKMKWTVVVPNVK